MKIHSLRGTQRWAALRAGFLGAVLGVGATACTPAESPDGEAGCTVSVGKAACEIEGEHVGGEEPATLGGARGKVLIVDFWATWCDPCKKSFPKYQQLVDKFAGEVAVIGVSVDDPDTVDVDEIKAFGQKHGNVSFALVWDKEKTTSAQYKPATMPTSYVIDKEGILRHVHVGFKSGELEVLEDEVETLAK